MPKKYNHTYTVAFSLVSSHPTGDDVTEHDLYDALTKRARDLWDNDEGIEAVGMPFDTYEVDDPVDPKHIPQEKADG